MLIRKVQKQIKEGKDALLITDARQIGKTHIIKDTLKEKCDFITFN